MARPPMTKAEKSDFKNNLSKELATQDGRGTSDPYYIVQQIERVWGFDRDHSADDYAWCDEEGNSAEDDDASRFENESGEGLAGELDEDGEPIGFGEEAAEKEGFRKLYYKDRWVFADAFLTNKAAQSYIRENAHKLRKPRVYGWSSCRNREIRSLREVLSNASEKHCPLCNRTLVEVTQEPGSQLNADQFEAQRPGDWFCSACQPSSPGHKFAYFWTLH